MSKFTTLIVGLGNPGDEYERTRHNIGFMAADAIAERNRCGVWKKKFRGFLAEGSNFLVLKPQTFMNNSGESVIEAANFYDLPMDKVFVFHDDLDLLPGQVKIKQGGGSGGHNGLKSIDAHLGQNYWRVRLGIGRPMTEQGVPVKGDAVVNFVLNPFAKADKKWLEPLIEAAGNDLALLLKGDHNAYRQALAQQS